MPRRASLRRPITQKKVSKTFGRLFRELDRPVRNCNFGDQLVLETDRLRAGTQPSPGIGASPIHQYFQIVVRFESDALTIRAVRVVSRGGSPIERETCPTSFVFSLKAGRAIEKAARKLQSIVRRPEIIVTAPGHQWPKSGRAGRCD